jgi:hypothetical protein
MNNVGHLCETLLALPLTDYDHPLEQPEVADVVEDVEADEESEASEMIEGDEFPEETEVFEESSESDGKRTEKTNLKNVNRPRRMVTRRSLKRLRAVVVAAVALQMIGSPTKVTASNRVMSLMVRPMQRIPTLNRRPCRASPNSSKPPMNDLKSWIPS